MPLVRFPAAGVAASFGFFATWTDTINIGSLVVGLLLGLAALAIFGHGVRFKTAYEAERAVNLSFRSRIAAMDEELRSAREFIIELQQDLVITRTELGRLQERPDLGRVLELIGEQSIRQDAAASRRQEQLLDVLLGRREGGNSDEIPTSA